MAKLDKTLIERLSELERGLAGQSRFLINMFLLFCKDELACSFISNKNRYRIPSSSAVVLNVNNSYEAFLFTESLGILDSDLGVTNRNHPLFIICNKLNVGTTFEFNEEQYRIVRKSKSPKLPKRLKLQHKKKKKTNKTFGIVCKESKDERRERIRNFFTEISQPIGLGKRR